MAMQASFPAAAPCKSIIHARWRRETQRPTKIHCAEELTTTPRKMMATLRESGVECKTSLSGVAPLEAILFDVDGTICDSDPVHVYAFRKMLKEIGYNGGVPIDAKFFNDNIAGKHNDDIARALFPDDFERGLKFMDEKEAYFLELVPERLKVVNGVYKMTNWVKERGLKRAAVTNSRRLNAEDMISVVGLSDFFDALIVGCECERPKPYPDPYLKALEVINAPKDRTIVFEDSLTGIRAGVAAGLPVIALTTANSAERLMEANPKPSLIIKDFEDPKLWAALEELVQLDDKGKAARGAA